MPTIYPITEGLHVCTTVACHFPELSDNSTCIKLAVKNVFMIFDLTESLDIPVLAITE